MGMLQTAPGGQLRKARQQGFTLIELSIVLVIIGLIVGGVLVGRSLIRNAELQSVLTDVSKFTTAINTFEQKYNALPGDMANATSYWYGTWNGNGDGRILNIQADTASGVWNDLQEMFTAWQHLALAGLIPGTFTGVFGPAGTWDNVPGTNVPTSRVPGAGYSLFYFGVYSDPNNYLTNYGHVFMFGSVHSNGVTGNGILSTAEATGIDSKIDDGLPGTGSVMSQKQSSDYAGGCTTSDDPTTAKYATTVGGTPCSLTFKLGF